MCREERTENKAETGLRRISKGHRPGRDLDFIAVQARRCQRRVLKGGGRRQGIVTHSRTSALKHHFGVEDGLKRKRKALDKEIYYEATAIIQARHDKEGLKLGMWTD